MKRVAVAKVEAKPTATAKRIRKIAMVRYAQEFHQAARKSGSPIVRAYLLGHALELYFKAFLVDDVFAMRDLKKKTIGHNLKRLMDEFLASDVGPSVHISQKTAEHLLELNKVYPENLRYFSLTFLFVPPTIPRLDKLFRLADGLSRVANKAIVN